MARAAESGGEKAQTGHCHCGLEKVKIAVPSVFDLTCQSI